MKFVYLFTCIFLIVYYVKLFIRNPRHGILIGLTFTSFTLFSFPWHFIPIVGFQAIVKNIFILLTLSYLYKDNKMTNKKFIIFIFLFWFMLIAYLPLAGFTDYGLEKSLRYFDRIILPVLAFSIIAPFNETDLKLIINTTIVGSLLTVLYILSYGAFTHTGRAFIDGGTTETITLGRIIGSGAIMALIMFFFKTRDSLKTKLLLLFIISFLIYGVLLAGSRGPLIAIIAAFIAVIMFTQRNFKKAIITFRVIGILLLILIPSIYFLDISHLLNNRAIYFILNPTDLDVNALARIDLYNYAFKGFIDSNGLGLGTGGYSLLPYTKHYWPHNIFLEIMVEWGLLGLVAFIYLIFRTAYLIVSRSSLSKNYVYFLSMYGFWFYSLYNANVSWDITGNHMFWITTCIIWMLNHTNEQVSKKSEKS